MKRERIKLPQNIAWERQSDQTIVLNPNHFAFFNLLAKERFEQEHPEGCEEEEDDDWNSFLQLDSN